MRRLSDNQYYASILVVTTFAFALLFWRIIVEWSH
jgi:hypothetical protein